MPDAALAPVQGVRIDPCRTNGLAARKVLGGANFVTVDQMCWADVLNPLAMLLQRMDDGGGRRRNAVPVPLVLADGDGRVLVGGGLMKELGGKGRYETTTAHLWGWR